MNNLRKLRNTRQMSRRELSELTGISARTILSWERGENQLDRAMYCSVVKLAEVLEVTPEELFNT